MAIIHPEIYKQKRALKASDVPDALWPSDNIYDIPVLSLEYQADAVDLPVTPWGTTRRKTDMRGTWLFYVDDYRFERVWKEPTQVINSGCINSGECNFSVFEQTPLAVALYHTYRKRWLARYWQEHGKIRIFADLNVAARWHEVNMLGIPIGWRSYCTRGSADHLDDIYKEYEMACVTRGGVDGASRDVIFLVYGGGKDVRIEAARNSWIWVPEQRDVAKNRFPEFLLNEDKRYYLSAEHKGSAGIPVPQIRGSGENGKKELDTGSDQEAGIVAQIGEV